MDDSTAQPQMVTVRLSEYHGIKLLISHIITNHF